MSFLDNYEDVNTRIKRFRQEFPSGRLVATIEDMDLTAGWILIKAEAYREFEDHVPSAVDFAYGNVATLTANMRKWLVEDTTTSAYGRCIGLLTPSDTARPTRQDMEKVEALPASKDPWATLSITQTAHETGTTALTTAVAEIGSQLGGELVAAAPRCPHGTMIWAEGTAKTTGKPWAAYKCTEKNRTNQCLPMWHVMSSDGKWKPQV
jgi:hypothetical protein